MATIHLPEASPSAQVILEAIVPNVSDICVEGSYSFVHLPNITHLSSTVASPLTWLAALLMKFPSDLLTPSAGDIKNSQDTEKP